MATLDMPGQAASMLGSLRMGRARILMASFILLTSNGLYNKCGINVSCESFRHHLLDTESEGQYMEGA